MGIRASLVLQTGSVPFSRYGEQNPKPRTLNLKKQGGAVAHSHIRMMFDSRLRLFSSFRLAVSLGWRFKWGSQAPPPLYLEYGISMSKESGGFGEGDPPLQRIQGLKQLLPMASGSSWPRKD